MGFNNYVVVNGNAFKVINRSTTKYLWQLSLQITIEKIKMITFNIDQ